MTVGYNKPLYILPFDHRASFQTGLFGWKGTLAPEQTARVAESKQVVYEGLKAAVAAGVPKDRAGILVDEQFGDAILADANKNGYITSAPAEKSGLDEFNFEYGADYGKHMVLRDGEVAKDFTPPEKSIAPSIGHLKEWAEACKGNGTPLCNFDYSGALTEAVLLGTIAYKSGQRLEWDAANLKITNSSEAQQLVHKEYRKGWVL